MAQKYFVQVRPQAKKNGGTIYKLELGQIPLYCEIEKNRWDNREEYIVLQ